MVAKDRHANLPFGKKNPTTRASKKSLVIVPTDLSTGPPSTVGILPKVLSTTVNFQRTPGARADISISATEVTRNEMKVVIQTFDDGQVETARSYPYNSTMYDLADDVSNRMPYSAKVEYLKDRWVEMQVKIPEISSSVSESDSAVLEQLSSLGPDFFKLVSNLVVRLVLPALSNLAVMTPSNIVSTPGYALVERIVDEVEKFVALEKLHVVLELPHTFTRGLHELQMVYSLPFHYLSFTDWGLRYTVPSMTRSKVVSDDDLLQLRRLDQSLFDSP
ncbi:uncharacterized protein LY89DRAFT_681464 [Mollisia scopiformis]|uniref:Uncharacterized protein n=1 Tax=Mollisia scopiformis TaxID=149040 RepID=A0A194XPR2_MOLSC|nr:uncharacterized protein LY89DRAFT_681464 [Mollisia scopiformis]KUJ22151.1 hypothetical protein LY89DRAFT_681464 [Mollisia scopiformis]